MVQRLTRRWCLAFANETGLHPNHQHLHHRRRPAAALRSTSIAAWSQGKSPPPPFLDFHSTSFKTKLNFGCGGKKKNIMAGICSGQHLKCSLNSQPKLFGFRGKKTFGRTNQSFVCLSCPSRFIFCFLTQK